MVVNMPSIGEWAARAHYHEHRKHIICSPATTLGYCPPTDTELGEFLSVVHAPQSGSPAWPEKPQAITTTASITPLAKYAPSLITLKETWAQVVKSHRMRWRRIHTVSSNENRTGCRQEYSDDNQGWHQLTAIEQIQVVNSHSVYHHGIDGNCQCFPLRPPATSRWKTLKPATRPLASIPSATHYHITKNGEIIGHRDLP